jgi:hypothetical protein
MKSWIHFTALYHAYKLLYTNKNDIPLITHCSHFFLFMMTVK